jgi:hypothetical protein
MFHSPCQVESIGEDVLQQRQTRMSRNMLLAPTLQLPTVVSCAPTLRATLKGE